MTLVEKAPKLLAHGQNIDVQQSARILVNRMGLKEDFKRLNTTEQGTNFIDDNGRAFAKFPVKEGKSASMTSEYEILRGDLAALLYDKTKDCPNVKYKFGTTVTNVQQIEGIVKVDLSNGEAGEYDLLVLADGQWSKLRKVSVTAVDVK